MISRTKSAAYLPTKAFACVAMFVLFSVFSFSSLLTDPPTGTLEDCRPTKKSLYTQNVIIVIYYTKPVTDHKILTVVWIVVSGGNQTTHQSETLTVLLTMR